MSDAKVVAKVNGEAKELAKGTTLKGLLDSLSLSEMQVFIEYNREPLSRELYAGTAIADGDNIEIVTMMAGG